VLCSVLKERHYEFDVERAIYLTVLHRLFASGSDRAAERWREDYLTLEPKALSCVTFTGRWRFWKVGLHSWFRESQKLARRILNPVGVMKSARLSSIRLIHCKVKTALRQRSSDGSCHMKAGVVLREGKTPPFRC
jgi:hypothetical protein